MTEVRLSLPLSPAGHHLLHGGCAWQRGPGKWGAVGSLRARGLRLPLLRGHSHHLAAAREQDQALVQGEQLGLTGLEGTPREAVSLALLPGGRPACLGSARPGWAEGGARWPASRDVSLGLPGTDGAC